MMKRLSIRWKLTLWYSGVLAVVLTAFGAAIYFTIRHTLLQRIDAGLNEELSDVLYEVNRAEEQQGLHGWLVRRFARHEGFASGLRQTVESFGNLNVSLGSRTAGRHHIK